MPSFWVGWTAPPHPIEFVPSVNPKDSKQQQARTVIYSAHYDDGMRDWWDKDSVHGAFGVKDSAQMDPVRVIEAYEHPSDPVWKKLTANDNALGWKDFDARVKDAVKRRLKLGVLPANNYKSDPVVIYYYDHDRMKKIVWPRHDIPYAIDPQSEKAAYYWRYPDVFTYETRDPQRIAKEQKTPGSPAGCGDRDKCRGAGNWDDEGFDWNKDMPGNADVVFTAIAAIVMEVVGTVLDMTGIGAALGVALNIIGAVVPALIGGIAGAIDAGLHGQDTAAAIAGIAKGLFAAAASGFSAASGVKLPKEATQALASTVDGIAKVVSQAQKQKLSYAETWNKVAALAAKFSKVGDEEEKAIRALLGPDQAGKLFSAGFEVGRLATMDQIAAIAQIVSGYATFAKSPAALNLFLLGAGVGHLAAHQEGLKPPILPSSKRSGSIARGRATFRRHATVARPATTRAVTHRTGVFVQAAADAARAQLDTFLDALEARYGSANVLVGLSPRERAAEYVLHHVGAPPRTQVAEAVIAHRVGQDAGAPVVWDPLAWGCPSGTWRDPFSGQCLPKKPLCPPGLQFDLGTGRCLPLPRTGWGW